MGCARFALLQAPWRGHRKTPDPCLGRRPLRIAFATLIVTLFQLPTRNFLLFNVNCVANTQSFRRGTDSQTFGGLRERCSLPPHPADAGLRAPAHRGAGRNPAPSRDAAAAWATGLHALMSVLQYMRGPWAVRCQCF